MGAFVGGQPKPRLALTPRELPCYSTLVYRAHGENQPGGEGCITTLAATIPLTGATASATRSQFETISNTLTLACPVAATFRAVRGDGAVEELEPLTIHG